MLQNIKKTAVVASDSKPAGSLRLTRRGKLVVGLAGVLLGLAPFGAFAFSNDAASASAEKANATIGYVVPQAGDSLWAIAAKLDSKADPRDLVAELMTINLLETSELEAYQPLAVPARFLGHEDVFTAKEIGI